MENEEWYIALIEDCNAIVTEKLHEYRLTFIECYHLLGQRILKENNNFERSKIYGEKIVQRVAESMGKSKRTVQNAVKFAKKYPDLSELPGGKEMSWHKICNNLLPEMDDKGKERRKKMGDGGENKARNLLKEMGYGIFEIDWIAEKGDEIIQVEVKNKECFKAPPFDGQGMDVWKVEKRLDFEKRYEIKAYLLCFDPEDNHVYGQYLSKLEEGEKFDTKNGVRIYDLKNFIILK